MAGFTFIAQFVFQIVLLNAAAISAASATGNFDTGVMHVAVVVVVGDSAVAAIVFKIKVTIYNSSDGSRNTVTAIVTIDITIFTTTIALRNNNSVGGCGRRS